MDVDRAPDPVAEEPPRPGPVVRALVAVVAFYQTWLSPMFLPHCRFHPTCSAYAIDALRERGVIVGVGLTLVRLAKCAPWHPGGLDPVPPRRRGRADRARSDACRSRTPDPGTGAPITEEQASC